MGKISGSKILISIEDEASPGTFIPVGFQSNGTLNVDGETADVTTKDDDGWGAFLQTRKSWSMDIDGLMDYADPSSGGLTLIDAIIEDKIVKVEFGIGATEGEFSGSVYWVGDATIANCSVSASDNEGSTYSGSIQGFGALTQATRA